MSTESKTLKDVLDHLLEGCQIIGRDWTYRYVNDALLRHGRKKREELIGKTMMEAYPGIEKTELFGVIGRCMETRQPQTMDNEFVYEDGSKGWFQLSMAPVPEGVLILSLDISDHKRAQEEIMRMNEELERRVVHRTEEVNAVNKELEAFAYSVSHDLRAPLRAVEGFSKILESEYGGRFDDEGKRILSIIIMNVRKMDTLIQDLLALSRVGRGSIKMGRVNMNDLVRSVFSEVAGEKQKDITFVVNNLPDAEADAVLLRQLWQNLISNAVKYSGGQQKAEIEVQGVQRNGETVYSIRDNGVGFDPAYAHKLFGVFQRLHRDDEFPGTGVGLAIVERIVHRHHGRVWAEGAVGRGAVISFALPESGSPS